MKLELRHALVLGGFIAFSVVAREPASAPAVPEAPDKEKVSYALGMRMGQQLKHNQADVDPDVIAQAIKDVMAGKPTKIQESEIPGLFQQAQAYGIARQSEKNRAEGTAFLARNAKLPNVTVLPDGLQYRVIQTGTGAIPTTNDIVVVKYRGTLVDGTEFDHNDQLMSRVIAGIKGWQEALVRMKVGSKWQLFVPSDLAYGHEGMPMRQIGPDVTLTFDLELSSIEDPDHLPNVGNGRMGHGAGPTVLPANPLVSGQGAATNKVSPDKNK